MFEILSAADVTIAGELIERTSSTERVQRIVQLSLAPVFLLAAIGAVMNVMTSRLIWIASRIEEIEHTLEAGEGGRLGEEIPVLQQRRVYAQRAVMFSTASALTICIVVGLLFVSAFIRPQIGTLTAVAWIVTMALLMIGLVLFLLETRLASGSAQERRKQSRAILRRKAEREAAD
jgi:hypothetical protein